MDLLEKLVKQYEQKTGKIEKILIENKGKATRWKKNERCFYILSKSAKKEGYQLTYFIDNEPISDMIRADFLDRNIIEELSLNECSLSKII